MFKGAPCQRLLTPVGCNLMIEEAAVNPPSPTDYQRFIPIRFLEPYLPKVLLEGYTHWANQKSIFFMCSVHI
jgi:hypothetical protein